MAIMASDSGGGNFTPAPPGVHPAICIDVVDLGLLETTYNKQTKKSHKIYVIWEIDEADEKGSRFTVRRRYTLSLGDKASLRKDLESWRARAFTPEELKGFDVEKLIGVNCQLNVVHEVRDNKTWANVTAIMPLGKGMQRMAASPSYVRVKDRKEGDAPQDGDFAANDEDVPF